MECSNVQEKLSVYIEGIISPEERKLIDEHLLSCPKCKEAHYDLRKTLEYVHNLEDMEPPAWLTQKVMAKIRSEAEPKKGILQKLFYPLHVKLPIEAVAVILIAVTALYVFKTIQPEMKMEKVPSEETTTQIPSQEKEKIPTHPSLIPPLVRGDTEGSKGGKGGFEAEQAIPSKKPETMDKLSEAPKAPTPLSKQDQAMPSAGIMAKDESKTEVLSRAAKAKASAEKKVEIINLTIHVRDVEAAIKKIERSLIELGAEIIKIEPLESKYIVTAKIGSQNLNQLIVRLKDIGEVKEKEVDLEAPESYLEIRIEIVRM